MKIQRIFIYPIKSLGPVEVTRAELTNEGLRFDRQYVLISPPTQGSGIAKHITIKSNFNLGLFQCEIDRSWSKLTVTHRTKTNAAITIPLTPSPLSLLLARAWQVCIFGTYATGIDMGENAAAYFSYHLERPVRLLYIGGNGRREIPGAAFKEERESISITVNDKLQPQKIRFADSAPLLITSTASEEDARRRLPRAARGEDLIVRFRPNIHVDVGNEQNAYSEDTWSMLSIKSKVDAAQEVSVRCLFRTVRCLSLNADLANGGMSATPQQLYGLLMKDRRVNEKFPHKPVFGQYACAGPNGAVLRVGDDVEITKLIEKSPTPLHPQSPHPETA